MEIKAINFDFYGTLMNWLPVWEKVAAKIINEHDLKISAKELAIEWRKAQRQFVEAMEFTPYKEVITLGLNLICEKYGIKNNEYHEILFRKWKEIMPFPEVGEVLKNLKSKYPLAVCTNSSRDLFDVSVGKLPISFNNIIISDETKVNKPNQGLYQKAIKALGFSPENILHIASSQMDVRGATKAGFVVCWINRLNEQLTPETPKPMFEITKLDEVLDIFSDNL